MAKVNVVIVRFRICSFPPVNKYTDFVLINPPIKEKLNKEKLLRSQLNDVQKKVDDIEEKYFVTTEMTKETFDKFYGRHKQKNYWYV